MNNNQKVIDYIRDNPQVGRKKLSELFGITESTARYLKVAALGVEEQNESNSITERDVARFLKERGLSIDAVNQYL